MRQQFDEELRLVLRNVVLLRGSEIIPAGGAVTSRGSNSASLTPAGALARQQQQAAALAAGAGAGGGRASELEPYVQQRCLELAAALADGLQARLDSFGVPADGLQVSGSEAVDYSQCSAFAFFAAHQTRQALNQSASWWHTLIGLKEFSVFRIE